MNNEHLDMNIWLMLQENEKKNEMKNFFIAQKKI